MSLKTENSRRVAKSRPVCMGLKALKYKIYIHIFQGILGADGRHYILDLFRTFPTDANFLEGLFLFIFLIMYNVAEGKICLHNVP